MVKPLVTWYLSDGLYAGGGGFVSCVEQCLASLDSDVILTTLEVVADRVSNSSLPKNIWAQTQVSNYCREHSHHQPSTCRQWEELLLRVRRQNYTKLGGTQSQCTHYIGKHRKLVYIRH